MPQFRCQVVDSQGQETTRIYEAINQEDARRQARDSGLFVVSIHLESAPKTGKNTKVFWKNVKQMPLFQVRSASVKDIFSFTRKLATLLEAGLPLLRSLKVLKDQKQSGFMNLVIERLEQDISSGETMSQSMSRFPSVFNRLYISMVRAGEIGGVLGIVLERLAEFFEQSHIFRKRVKHAMFYPALILSAAVFVVAVLLLFVIPKFEVLFDELNVELPYATMILLGISSFVQKFYWLMGLLLLGGFFGIRLFLKVRGIRGFWNRLCLYIPFWGSLIEKVEVVRFCRLLGTLLQSGVPILQAFDIAKTASSNIVFVEAITLVQAQVREGSSLAQPMSHVAVFPKIMVNMIDVGEESGQLDEMLLKVAQLYEEDVQNMIETMTKMIEPALIMFLAFLVGFIVVAMFLPLVTMMNALGR